jgi:hypothetical protein
MLLQKRHQVRAADFFLSFKEENEVHRKLAVLLNALLDSEHMS